MRTGSKMTEENRIKLSKAHKGLKHSEETKKKIRKSKLGHIVLEETRIKMSEAHKGLKHTKEAREKMSKSRIGKESYNKGIKHTKKHKEKLKFAWIKRKKDGNGVAWNKDKKGSQVAWNKGIRHIKISGKNHPNWKGGISLENQKIRHSIEYKSWQVDIFERDKYLCQMPECDKTERYLNAHHIKKFADFPKLRFKISNGITLCKKCHRKTFWKEEKYEELFTSILKLIS